MRALVLSGGSAKGAYQAGAVAAILRAGYRPDIITGISVGALNGGYLVSRAARAVKAAGAVGEAGAARPVDWGSIGAELAEFWRRRITGPDVLLRRRSALDLGWRLIRKRWAGLVAMDRLYGLVREELAPEDFTDPPVRCGFGAVSLETGAIAYSPVDPATRDAVLDFILASTQVPIAMPLYPIGGRRYYDGGLRDLAPLKGAIALGATRIVCVACQPADVGLLGEGFEAGDPLDLVGRVLEIVANELLNGDLETLVETNRLLGAVGPEAPGLAGKRVIPLLVVRPRAPLAVEITRFGPADVAGMLGQGGSEALLRVAEAALDPGDPGHEIGVELAARSGGPSREVRPAA